ncbi:MAG TPA: hypothetical protein VN821_16005 [Candidatus Udaeobacter sp.]|nr:hypothetical protein [Candidatus Udaeobacter sp.]
MSVAWTASRKPDAPAKRQFVHVLPGHGFLDVDGRAPLDKFS